MSNDTVFSLFSFRRNTTSAVKPVCKGHSREPENVPFMSTCPVVKIICIIHTLGEMKLSFIDRDLTVRQV